MFFFADNEIKITDPNGVTTYGTTPANYQNYYLENCSFIFSTKDLETATHELFHGLGLKHAFKDDHIEQGAPTQYLYTQSNTDNLMDYDNKSIRQRIWDWQRKIIHSGHILSPKKTNN